VRQEPTASCKTVYLAARPSIAPKNQGGRFRVPVHLHHGWKANYFFFAVFFAAFFGAFFAAFFVAIAILPFDH
jgi:hypothetical protein